MFITIMLLMKLVNNWCILVFPSLFEDGPPPCSPAKVRWLKAYNKVRLQLHEVGSTGSLSWFTSFSYILNTKTKSLENLLWIFHVNLIMIASLHTLTCWFSVFL